MRECDSRENKMYNKVCRFSLVPSSPRDCGSDVRNSPISLLFIMFQAGIQHSRAAMSGALQGPEPGKYSGGMARDVAGE